MKRIAKLKILLLTLLPFLSYGQYDAQHFQQEQILDSPIIFSSSNHIIDYTSDVGFVMAEGFDIKAIAQQQFGTRLLEREGQNMNWILSRSFDENGQVSAASMSFLDDMGLPVQSQTMLLTEKEVIASQGLKDRYGRHVITTLPAPIRSESFDYRDNFVCDVDGKAYNYQHFDGNKKQNPDQIGNTREGTLGWYYSNYNTTESYAPSTAYPYSRTEYYDDGSGELKCNASPGEKLRLGMGHERYSQNFPLLEELNGAYLSIRNQHIFPGVAPLNDLSNQGVKTISIDGNGKESIDFMSKEGKLLASGVPNGTIAPDTLRVTVHVPLPTIYYYNITIPSTLLQSTDTVRLKVHGGAYVQLYNCLDWQVQSTQETGLLYDGFANGNEWIFPLTPNSSGEFQLQIRSLQTFSYEYLTVNGWENAGPVENTSSENYRGKDFYIPKNDGNTTVVTLSNNTGMQALPLKLKERTTETLVYDGAFTGASSMNLNGGFYTIDFFDHSDTLKYYPLSLDYRGYLDLQYYYIVGNWTYNYYDVAGRQVSIVSPNGVAQFQSGVPYADIDKSTYEYDLQGRLMAKNETDAGRTEYMYTKDGNIRFSQDAEQRLNGRFSYVNYDRNGRGIEAGEFVSNIVAGQFGGDVLKSILDNTDADGGLTGGNREEWNRSTYDLPDPEFSVQTGLSGYIQDFIMGNVSYTENEEVKTWYSYDEFGQISWLVQKIKALNRIFTVDYEYDFHGHVTQVLYQKELSAERFYHHYTYDADQRLEQVHTSRDGTNKDLQATYHYYLHGPLKRVELADQLQGIDYVYTIQGALKAMNHPNTANDPGKDGTNGFAPDVFGMTLEYFDGDYSRSNTMIQSFNPSGIEDQYAGTIKSMSWYTQKPDLVGTANHYLNYSFVYNDLYQLEQARLGAVNLSTGIFSQEADNYKVKGLDYDANGNLLTLQRHDQNGAILHDLTYSYAPNSNRLTNVSNYAAYSYNAIGQLIHENPVNGPDKYLAYNASGKLAAIYADAAHTQPRITFRYDDRGFRLSKKDHSNGKETWYIRDASGNLLSIYDNDNAGNTLEHRELPIYAAGKLGAWYATDNTTLYEIRDHLGNVRITLARSKKSDGTADVNYYADYYPFGHEMASAGIPYRYGYQGEFAERDLETGWNAFEARMYDPVIGRWLSTDPARQYYSPYLAMGNDPVNAIDPDGEFAFLIGAAVGAIAGGLGKIMLDPDVTWSNALTNRKFWGGVASGAITGLIGGGLGTLAVTTMETFALSAFSGLIGGGIGSIVSQNIENGGRGADPKRMLVDAVTGGITGPLGTGVSKIFTYVGDAALNGFLKGASHHVAKLLQIHGKISKATVPGPTPGSERLSMEAGRVMMEFSRKKILDNIVQSVKVLHEVTLKTPVSLLNQKAAAESGIKNGVNQFYFGQDYPKSVIIDIYDK